MVAEGPSSSATPNPDKQGQLLPSCPLKTVETKLGPELLGSENPGRIPIAAFALFSRILSLGTLRRTGGFLGGSLPLPEVALELPDLGGLRKEQLLQATLGLIQEDHFLMGLIEGR